MKASFSPEFLESVEQQFLDHVANYQKFLDWASGNTTLEYNDPSGAAPWKAPFMVFAAKGRMEVFLQFLEGNGQVFEPEIIKLITDLQNDLDRWLEDRWSEVSALFDRALPGLLASYRDSYLPEKKHIGWAFDEFMEERDVLEFFVIGVGETFPIASFVKTLRKHDQAVRNHMASLGVQKYSAEYFPGQMAWFPAGFWWHHFTDQS